MISDKTATIVIAIVTTMWVLNLVVGMLGINDYQTSESVNGIFMAIVGGAFALRGTKGDGNNRGGDHRK